MLSEKEVLDIGIQLCTVLEYLHTNRPPIIFRDLKPANIMRTRDGHIYLIDFGIARHFKLGQTKDTVAFGSQGYAAPEQYGKATTPRSDIYSLGVVLHELITGNNPSRNQMVPVELESLFTQMSETDENKRPYTIAAVKQELQHIAAQMTAFTPVLPKQANALQPVAVPTFGQQNLSNQGIGGYGNKTGQDVKIFVIILTIVSVLAVGILSLGIFSSYGKTIPNSDRSVIDNNHSSVSRTSLPTLVPTPMPTSTPVPPTPTSVLPPQCANHPGASPNGVEATKTTINCTLPSGFVAMIVVCDHAHLLQPFNQDLEGPGMISYQNPDGSSSVNIEATNSALANASCPSKFLVLPLAQVDEQVAVEVQRLKNLIGNNAGITYYRVVGTDVKKLTRKERC